MTGWAMWSTGNCTRNLTIRTNGICTTQNLHMHKLLWDFEIKTDHPISARRPDLIIINKKESTCRIVDFAVPADHRVKLKECKKRDKYLNCYDRLLRVNKWITQHGDMMCYTNVSKSLKRVPLVQCTWRQTRCSLQLLLLLLSQLSSWLIFSLGRSIILVIGESPTTSTLLGNWKNCGTWKWQLYQLWSVLLIQSPKDWYKDWRT